MTKKLLFGLATAAVLTLGAFVGSASAHHSVSAQFDYDKPFDFKTATLSKIEWINPHSYLFFVIPDETGKPTNWSIESHGVATLREKGLSRDTLKVGTNYQIKGFRARDGANNGFLQELVTPDGKVFHMAATDSGK